MNLITLLTIASLTLIGFSLAGIALLQADDRTRRSNARRLSVTTAYRAAEPSRAASRRRSIAMPAHTFRRQAKALIGMDPDRRDAYSVRLVLVLPVSLISGWIAQWLMHGLLGSMSWLLLPLVATTITRSVFRGDDAKRTTTLYKQFPDALATIVRAVRVGIPVTEALRAVAVDAAPPTSTEFSRLYDQVGVGTPLDEALRDMSSRNHLPEYRFFAAALALQSQTGGGLTETLENLADVIRKRVALKARGYALASEARTSAGVLTALPVFSGVALAVLDPEYMGTLFREGSGQTLFGITVVWLGTGVWTMRLMIRKSLT